MKVRCSHELFEMFPAASIHGAIFDHVNYFSVEAAEYWKHQAMKSVREGGIRPELLVDSPAIKEWRKAFKTFGVKPSKYRSSIEQLYKMALKGNIIQTRLPLVNLYCYVSLIHMVPMGGYDLQSVQGDITVRLTKQGEVFTPIGESEPIRCDPGVVVYADEAEIICWAWNHRDASCTCLNVETRKAIFFADSASEESRDRAAEAIGLLSKALLSEGTIKLGYFVLDQQQNEAHISI